MKYKSSLTNEVKLVIIILFCYWIANIWLGSSHNSIKDLVFLSLWILVFGVIFILILVKGIYVVIENNTVKYVHMFVWRRMVRVEEIKKIQKGLMSGLYTSLSLTYEEDGKEKNIKISSLTFKKDTLKRLVSDLKNQNPNINVDQPINELLTK